MATLQHARAFTTNSLQETLATADTPVVVDFWAPRCRACQQTIQTVDDLACRIRPDGVVGTFNVTEDPETAKGFGVESVPTLLVFRAGTVDAALEGKAQINDFLDRIDAEVFFGTPPSCST